MRLADIVVYLAVQFLHANAAGLRTSKKISQPVAPAAVPVAAPVAAPAAAPATIVVVAPAPCPPQPCPVDIGRKERKRKRKRAKKAKKEAEKEAEELCTNTCDAMKEEVAEAKKEHKKQEEELAKAVEEGKKKIEEAVKNAVNASLTKIKVEMQKESTTVSEKLKAEKLANHKLNNETVIAAIKTEGDKIKDLTRQLFHDSLQHELGLAEQVQHVVWRQGLAGAQQYSVEESTKAGEEVTKAIEEKLHGSWGNAVERSENAVKVSENAVKSILEIWQAQMTAAQGDFTKLSKAFGDSNLAAKAAHDAVVHLLTAEQVSDLLMATAVVNKADAQAALDKAGTALNAAKTRLQVATTNKGRLAKITEKVEAAAGAAVRATDASQTLVLGANEMAKG